jgi:hypothetical protein
MMAWILLAITALLGCLTYDAFSLRSDYKSLPYIIIAKTLGQDVRNLPRETLERQKAYYFTRGIGDVDRVPIAFLILFVGFATGTVFAFFG